MSSQQILRPSSLARFAKFLAIFASIILLAATGLTVACVILDVIMVDRSRAALFTLLWDMTPIFGLYLIGFTALAIAGACLALSRPGRH